MHLPFLKGKVNKGKVKKYGIPMTGTYEHKHLQVPTFFNIIKTNNPKLVTALFSVKHGLGISSLMKWKYGGRSVP
jgi:hypothetical protein